MALPLRGNYFSQSMSKKISVFFVDPNNFMKHNVRLQFLTDLIS